MLHLPEFAWPGDDADLRRLVAAHPWVTLISATSAGLVVSHLPVLPDHGTEDLAILGHLARSDAEQHELGSCETVVVVEGVQGYVSPGWYVGGPYVPTWNFVVAHLHGRPDVLDAEQTYDVLGRTVDHFEQVRSDPFLLEEVAEYGERLAPHVVGFRLVPSRTLAKAKLSQDKPTADVEGVLRGLEDPTDPHRHPELAAAMRRDGIPDDR